MKKRILTLVALAAILATLAGSAGAASPPTTFYYGDVSLSGGYQAGHYPQVWDLAACDMQLQFTYDANELVDDAGAHAWAELGVRADGYGYGDFNPTWMTEGAGVWLATDYDWTVNTFDPDPVGAPTLDLDDKLILQKGGGWGEGSYNLPSTPPAPGNNHRVWWDRDGVDPYQNPATANTGGLYNIVIKLHASDATNGTAYMTINGLAQGFETDGNWNTIELTPAGMTFTGDMSQMQVFYGLYGDGATHSVQFKDIAVTGCLVLDDGMATGGGWFIPEDGSRIGLSSGGKATFGFVAKQKNGVSSGQLEFQYHADNLSLKSTSYDWVTVSATQAMFEGVGTINGEGSYRFRVRAVDGDKLGTGTDRFEIRIWTGNSDSWDMPTYRAGGDLGGGQIVVHKK